MIDPRYVRTMARYNSWQNGQLMPVFEALTKADLVADRGAFFGSLLGTANHLLWGDMMWMSRFDKAVKPPPGGLAESTSLQPTAQSWAAERFRLDGRIMLWAERLRALDLKADLTWYSGVARREMRAPLATCVIHFFNHQTHHRGQIHAMLTAAGRQAPVSDFFLMPEDA